MREIKVRPTREEIKIGNAVFEIDARYNAVIDANAYLVNSSLSKLGDKVDWEILKPELDGVVNILLLNNPADLVFNECGKDALSYAAAVADLVKQCREVLKA
jgi:hypothetical protein